MTKAAVYAAMAHAGLYFSTQGPGSSNGSWKSAVGVRPQAGTAVPWHSTVIVLTSLHSAIAPGRMPNVVGMAKAQVNAAMAKADLFYRTTGLGSANGTWVRVVGEKPRAGTVVAPRSTVTLVTTTRATSSPRAPAEVRVPNVVHLSKPQVIRIFKRDGLTWRATGPGSANGTWVRVAGESPRPGTKIARHGVVTLTTQRAKVPHPTTTTTPATTSTTSSLPGSGTEVTTTSSGTTTVPATTTTVHAATRRVRRPPRYRVGIATWYSYFPGRCATSYLPFGTRITIRDLSSGRVIHCVVTDRQPVSANRVVDLSETQFRELAPLWRGVVRVKVSW